MTPPYDQPFEWTGRFATASGAIIDVVRPDPATFDIEDIALGLSHQPRFLGHTRVFYSVAEHCINCVYAELAHDDDRGGPDAQKDLHLLLHDASEAYLGDLPSPIKAMPAMIAYRDVESKLQHAIYRRFGVSDYEMDDYQQLKEPAWLKTIDHRMLVTEARDVWRHPPTWLQEPWAQTLAPYRSAVVPKQNPDAVRRQYLAMFALLKAGDPYPRRRASLRQRRRPA